MANRMHEKQRLSQNCKHQGQKKAEEPQNKRERQRERERERGRKRRRGCKGRPKHPEQTEGASKLARAHIRKARTKLDIHERQE